MDVNVKGTFLTSKAVLRGMIRRKAGAILNIGSLAGTRTIDAPIHYCASKAAILGLTQSMAKEVARYGIRVNCLAPGLLEDGLGKNLPEHRLADYLEHTALRQGGPLRRSGALRRVPRQRREQLHERRDRRDERRAVDGPLPGLHPSTSIRRWAISSDCRGAIVRLVRAEGCAIEDDSGRRFDDWVSGFGAFNLGHNPEAILDVLREQLTRALPTCLSRV